MTTAAAMLGAIPLALAYGVGAEMRQPLGLSVLGGLLLSQLLTLYTTPIVFVGLERLRARVLGPRVSSAERHNLTPMNGQMA
jgi:multidrug efflux pump